MADIGQLLNIDDPMLRIAKSEIPQEEMDLGQGVAPRGIRHSGEGVKGKGYFGDLPQAEGGISTELSAESEINGKVIEYPLLVPTLTASELKYLLSGNQPTEEIYTKAMQHAVERISKGLSPFAQPNELRYPLPQE